MRRGSLSGRKFILSTGLLIILSQPLPPACADIYRYVDREGTTHYTNVPDSRKFTLWRREKRVLLRPALQNGKYETLIAAAAGRHGVDHALIKAIIKAESNFDANAVSPKGARGLMQLMPQTAAILQVEDSFVPEANIDGGVRYLRYLIHVYNGRLPYALAAYNAGEKAVARHQGIPPYTETRDYVRRVLDLYERYRNEMTSTSVASVNPPRAGTSNQKIR